MKRLFAILAGMLLAGSMDQRELLASVKSELIEETMEQLARRLGREATEETLGSFRVRVTRVAEEHGEEGLLAVRKTGTAGLVAIEHAGDDAQGMARLLARFGDEGLWVAKQPGGMSTYRQFGEEGVDAFIRHRGVAPELIEQFGEPVVGALKNVSVQNGRRMAMLHGDGVIVPGQPSADLLAVIERHGDRAMEFIWRHKGALATGAVLAAFLRNPEPFIDGTAELTQAAVGKAMELPLQVGMEAARRINWTFLSVVVMGLVAVVVLVRRRGGDR